MKHLKFAFAQLSIWCIIKSYCKAEAIHVSFSFSNYWMYLLLLFLLGPIGSLKSQIQQNMRLLFKVVSFSEKNISFLFLLIYLSQFICWISIDVALVYRLPSSLTTTSFNYTKLMIPVAVCIFIIYSHTLCLGHLWCHQHSCLCC